mmetsp:Transcript_661/g.896  ORF Transcript_661/g.896 Transcript_661/m.896 type:complete len:214 (+) Transcript_661:1128-1769(+)
MDVIGEVGLGEGLDIFFGSEDGATEARALECGGVEVVEDEFFLLLVDLGHFPEDDIALAFDGALVEFGLEEDIGEDLDGLADVLLEYLCEIDRLFTGGVGVEVSAHVLDFDLELLLGAFGGALEGHVFEEVCGSVVLGGFVAGSCVDPYAYGCGFGAGNGFGGDAEAVGCGGDVGGWGTEDIVGEGGRRRCLGAIGTRLLGDSSLDSLANSGT